jgi:hypothetical protein
MPTEPSQQPRADTVYGRFRALPPHRRVIIGVVGIGLSILGLVMSDAAEQQTQPPPRPAAAAPAASAEPQS